MKGSEELLQNYQDMQIWSCKSVNLKIGQTFLTIRKKYVLTARSGASILLHLGI